jgi:cephalosporin hydroxylase
LIVVSKEKKNVFTKKATKRKKPLDLPFLEDSLDMPLRELLELMGHQIKKRTMYFGIRALKNPLDFWIYCDIISEVKPDIVIEIGNRFGGSTLALAHVLDNLQRGNVIGIDIDHSQVPRIVKRHPRIKLITGDACESLEKVKEFINKKDKVLIIEDSAHTYENTLNVLRKFSFLVTRGSYFIVEDSIGHHGLDEGPHPGSYEAIEEFMKDNDDFQIDRTKENYVITWNPKGFLKKIK